MTNRIERLNELDSYGVLNHKQDEELNDLAKIASLALNVPIAQITFVHDEFTFVKANIDVVSTESIPGRVKRRESFCHHSIKNPKETMIVNDASKDSRFINNPFVNSDPHIRFYAGKPLTTPAGNPLGTICVIDNKPRNLSLGEKQLLDILSKKIMAYLNNKRKLLNQENKIIDDALRLQNLTDRLPVGIFQLDKSNQNNLRFKFLNKTMKEMCPSVNTNKSSESIEILFSSIYPDDKNRFINHLNESFDNLSFSNIQFRIKKGNNCAWFAMKGNVERRTDGSKTFYASIRNIDNQIEYEKTLEQIAFDISHVLRRPVSSLSGLVNLVDTKEKLNKKELLEYIGLVKTVSTEMESYTRKLNDIYQKKKEIITNHNKSYT
ncbi:GAF domain-containing protein [Echinicola jeungdonensis]|uniref:GAF domain-containing protein n=1 Tax=Echinicola jeungdonensis TaxID=709343 RepID=A0ABV5J2K6_9BACT|nr:GAF domain-containing protein [Echinicola jeungdonensis]MDN3668242.1 GAF domain-containing protein [Echinicola jeungdonensis]